MGRDALDDLDGTLRTDSIMNAGCEAWNRCLHTAEQLTNDHVQTKCQKTELSVTLCIQYPIDKTLLRKYAASSAANTVHKHDDANPNGETDREIIQQFLKNEIDGNCSVEYEHREVGTALIANGHITHARIYARKPYRNCAFELPSRTRAYALSSLYYDLADSKCFHRIVIGTSNNEKAREIAQKLLVTKEGHKPQAPGDV